MMSNLTKIISAKKRKSMSAVEYMRNNIKGIQVSRTTFVNDEDHRIVFQGMIHIGDKRFYDKIKSLCEDFDGEVHFESIRNAENDIVSQSLKSGYKILALLNNVDDQTNVLTKDFIKSQPDKFKNYDSEFSEVKSFLHSEETMQSIKDLANTDKSLFSNRFLIFATFNPLVMSNLLNKDSAIDLNKVVVENRDEFSSTKAIELGAKQADKKKNDVLMVWGAKHLSGISERLFKQGYKVTNVNWDTVIPWVKHNKLPHKIREVRLLKAQEEILQKIESDEWKSLWKEVTGEESKEKESSEEKKFEKEPISSISQNDESHIYEEDDPVHGDYSI